MGENASCFEAGIEIAVTESRGRPLVLVVDEVPAVIRLLELELNFQGFGVAGAKIEDGVLEAIETLKPDIILLEVILPGFSGFEVLKEIKSRFNIPVVFLTTQDSEGDKIFAFDLGADGYISKPFEAYTLATRLRSLLGAQDGDRKHTVLAHEAIRLDVTRELARIGPQAISLTTNEWALILALAADREAFHDAKELTNSIWGIDDPVKAVPALEIHIGSLRRKLGEDILEGDQTIGFRLNMTIEEET